MPYGQDGFETGNAADVHRTGPGSGKGMLSGGSGPLLSGIQQCDGALQKAQPPVPGGLCDNTGRMQKASEMKSTGETAYNEGKKHMESTGKKKEELCALMDKLAAEDIMVAFSGGVDSSLLLKAACDSAGKTGKKVYAATVQTQLHPSGDMEVAQRVAGEMGASHIVLEIDELAEAGIGNNPTDRCYRCKKFLFQKMKQEAQKLGVPVIVEGTNEDDLHVYRPGIRAIRELGIASPLAELGITKAQVREIAADYGISVSERPSAPCLATRFPYGTLLDMAEMEKVDEGEGYLKSLGLYNVRIRVHGEVARIEVDEKDMAAVMEHRVEIVTALENLGFVYVTLDLKGFRSGSMDVGLNV